MSDHVLKVDVAEWVRRAEASPISYQERQTVEITLNAIAMAAPINVEMFLKGGILMGLAYDSPRHTTDIDLTTALAPGRGVAEQVCKLLDSMLPRAATALGEVQTKSEYRRCEIPSLEAQDRLSEARDHPREGIKEASAPCPDRC